jgi:hypothetical protein
MCDYAGKNEQIKKAVLRMHLTSNGCVTIRREVLTYSRVRSAFAAACALPLDVIYILKTAFCIYICGNHCKTFCKL